MYYSLIKSLERYQFQRYSVLTSCLQSTAAAVCVGTHFSTQPSITSRMGVTAHICHMHYGGDLSVTSTAATGHLAAVDG